MANALSIDLSKAIPPTPPELTSGLQDVLAQLGSEPNVGERLRRNRIGGSDEDREAGAVWLGRRLGAKPSLDRVVVAHGTQNLLGLLLRHCIGERQTLLAEALTYPVLVPLAARYGVKIRAVAIDKSGLLPDAFEAACQRWQPKALFCNPTVHNPTTSVLPAARRRSVVSIARRYGVVIIEDDVLGPLHKREPPPLATIGPDVVWYIQSLSKCIALGLKVAFLVGPNALNVQQLVSPVSNHSFWFPSALAAEIATRLIQSGRAEEICQSIADHADQRQAIARNTLRDFSFQSEAGGLHIWLNLPSRISGGTCVAKAAALGVQIRAAEAFSTLGKSANDSIPQAVRIALTSPTTDAMLQDGLARLASILYGSTDLAP
ncbi:PLP-dependent aminotransferase family protein [Bradyrhizobium sp. BEA-2-5]|uniref:aminotransferase-like domain-containing protein n=1 Tax=Bradyrhizobium sp. BEA-2-5 TaxID=3080015 RepID=UPI00293E4501|nr:PLP-dependent aminotransferase family protein [Bradyrhizobium sp. BEA-2-5]WOH80292.1 PLP-dependent aminotransferase family protein [Bradyrhizobium sp. BEA-2-5]